MLRFPQAAEIYSIERRYPMLSVYAGRHDVYIVRGKMGNELKIENCFKVPYSDDKQNLASVIYDALETNKINDKDVTFVVESAVSMSKYITVDENVQSVENEVLADLQKIFITRADYAVSFEDVGAITIDGEKKRNILAVAVPGEKVSEMIELAHLIGLSPKGIETGVSAMQKLVKILPQMDDEKYSVIMIGEGDFLTLTLYKGRAMLFSRYVPIDATISEVLDIVSLMGQYLARVDKKARIEQLLYTATRNDSKNLVSVVSNNLRLNAERLTPAANIKCKGNYVYDDFAFMLGSLDVRGGINLFRDSLDNPSRRKVKLEMEFVMDEEEIYRFTKRLSSAVYASGGDVKSLKINKS